MRAVTFSCFTSSVKRFGNVTLEAMASGLPVIVESGCSGHLVRIIGENGFACTANDADAFLRQHWRWWHNHNLRRAFSEKSQGTQFVTGKHAVAGKMLDN
jgi:glycosyltransferase involved in cell wall biosynthesis